MPARHPPLAIGERNIMPQLLYRNYYDEQTYTDVAEFAVERVNMVAPLLGGARDVAIEYTWSVSDDDGATFRNPTSAEQEVLYTAIWDHRSSGIDCSRDCQLRGRFDGIWRCLTCSAVWTSPEGGSSYGVPLTPSQVRRAIDEVRDDSGAPRHMVSSRLEHRDAHALADCYEARVNGGTHDRLIMAVRGFLGISYRFLVVHAEDGNWYVRWTRTL